MYSDDDPYLAQLRDVCLAFPESCEVEAWGRPTFRAGRKLFAVLSGEWETATTFVGDMTRKLPFDPSDLQDDGLAF